MSVCVLELALSQLRRESASTWAVFAPEDRTLNTSRTFSSLPLGLTTSRTLRSISFRLITRIVPEMDVMPALAVTKKARCFRVT